MRHVGRDSSVRGVSTANHEQRKVYIATSVQAAGNTKLLPIIGRLGTASIVPMCCQFAYFSGKALALSLHSRNVVHRGGRVDDTCRRMEYVMHIGQSAGADRFMRASMNKIPISHMYFP